MDEMEWDTEWWGDTGQEEDRGRTGGLRLEGLGDRSTGMLRIGGQGGVVVGKRGHPTITLGHGM